MYALFIGIKIIKKHRVTHQSKIEFSLIGTLIKIGHKNFYLAQKGHNYIEECDIAHAHIYELMNNGTKRSGLVRRNRIHRFMSQLIAICSHSLFEQYMKICKVKFKKYSCFGDIIIYNINLKFAFIFILYFSFEEHLNYGINILIDIYEKLYYFIFVQSIIYNLSFINI